MDEELEVMRQMYRVANEQKAMWRKLAVSLASLVCDVAHGPVGAINELDYIHYITKEAERKIRFYNNVIDDMAERNL